MSIRVSEDPRGPIDFYGGPFSNFAYSAIFMDTPWGKKSYPTVEHAFQAAKATTEKDHDWVRKPRWPSEAKHRGRKIKIRRDWEAVKYDVMVACLREKFALPEFKRRLLDTGTRELREKSPTDLEWGWGENGEGRNLLGKALMQVRGELQ